MAKKASPLAKLRLSIETPPTSAGSAPDFSARMALAISSTVQSALMLGSRSGRQSLFPSPLAPLEGEGGLRGAIASASRERGMLMRSAPLSRPRSASPPLGHPLPQGERGSERAARATQDLTACSSDPALQRGGDRVVIVERQHLTADDLPGFVALAGDQQRVAALELADGGADRRAALADFGGAGRGAKDGGADRGRAL